MTRHLLPNRRESYNFTISFAGEKYDVTIGFYPNGQIGETFVNRIRDKTAAKLGEQLDGICRDSAILLSFALQHGASLKAIKRAVTRNDDSEPSTIVGALVDLMEDPDEPSAQDETGLPGGDRPPDSEPASEGRRVETV